MLSKRSGTWRFCHVSIPLWVKVFSVPACCFFHFLSVFCIRSSSHFLIVPHSSLILNRSAPSQLSLLSKLQKPRPPLEVAHPLLLLPLPSLTWRRAVRQRSGCCLPCWRTRPGAFMPTRPSCSSVWLWVSGSWSQPLFSCLVLLPNPSFPFSLHRCSCIIFRTNWLTCDCWKQAFA